MPKEDSKELRVIEAAKDLRLAIKVFEHYKPRAPNYWATCGIGDYIDVAVMELVSAVDKLEGGERDR